MTRTLAGRPEVELPSGVALRTYSGPADIAGWLSIREQAFSRQPVGVRGWTERDFDAEFLAKPDWNPAFLWFADSTESTPALAVGTVAIAWRSPPPAPRPAIHWLAVRPRFRRRGIGRLLVHTAEATCWDLGCRQMWLETHVAWTEALALYQALGYRPTAGEFSPPDRG